jgi:hypothetical protein
VGDGEAALTLGLSQQRISLLAEKGSVHERFKGRQDLLDYAEEKGIPVTSTKSKPWSMDENSKRTWSLPLPVQPWETAKQPSR